MILQKFLLKVWKGICRFLRKVLLAISGEEEPPDVEIPGKIIGGYFWADASKITTPSEIEAKYLTHIYYAFLEVQEDGTLEIQNFDRIGKYNMHVELSNLRCTSNPHLKVLFSVVSKNNTFSSVASNIEKRKVFVESALKIIMMNQYDDLDLDWEFPKEADKDNFVALLCDLSEAFVPFGILLTVAVRAIPIYENSGYDVPQMSRYVDLLNIMTYDFYGGWSDHTGFNSPLYPSSLDSPYERKYLSVDAALNNWIAAGAPKEKICIGIPFYGRSFNIAEDSYTGIHADSAGPGLPAALTYQQIMSDHSDWPRVWSDEQKAPYKWKGRRWIGYDDEESIQEKVKYALEKDIAGVFVWQIGGDDLKGDNDEGIQYYLLYKIYTQMMEECPPKDEDSEEEKEESPPPKMESKESSLINLEEIFLERPESTEASEPISKGPKTIDDVE